MSDLVNKIRAIEWAYEQSHREYHNYEYWEDEQWDRIKIAMKEAVAEAERVLTRLKETTNE